jgi:sugar-specific transcriptional regulator TrmB
MNKKVEIALKETGMTDNEVSVYSALLEMGSRSASVVARRTGLHRRVVYDVLDRLIKKGLVGYILENGSKVFSVSNPNRFVEIKKEEMENIEGVLPDLMSFYSNAQDKQREDTLFFKGKNGLRSVFEDQLGEKEILVLGVNSLAYEILEIYFHWFDKKRVKNKIKTKIIFNSKSRFKLKNIPLSEVRFLPEKYSSPLAVNIYGDKVAIILWSKENLFAIVVKNKEIAEGYRKHFEVMWKVARE